MYVCTVVLGKYGLSAQNPREGTAANKFVEAAQSLEVQGSCRKSFSFSLFFFFFQLPTRSWRRSKVSRYSVYLLSEHKSTNTDTPSTKVQILTRCVPGARVIDRYFFATFKGVSGLGTRTRCPFFFLLLCQALGLSIDAEKLKGFWRLVFTNDAKFVGTGGASGFAGIIQRVRP